MAFESEVASIYCSRLPISGFVDRDNFGIHQIGQKFLVLDAGSNFKNVNSIKIAFLRSTTCILSSMNVFKPNHRKDSGK